MSVLRRKTVSKLSENYAVEIASFAFAKNYGFFYNVIQIYSGTTCGRVLNGELYT